MLSMFFNVFPPLTTIFRPNILIIKKKLSDKKYLYKLQIIISKTFNKIPLKNNHYLIFKSLKKRKSWWLLKIINQKIYRKNHTILVPNATKKNSWIYNKKWLEILLGA